MRSLATLASFTLLFSTLPHHLHAFLRAPPREEKKTNSSKPQESKPAVKQEVPCDIEGRPYRFEARYVGQNGVGYSTGYTTASLLLTRPYFGFNSWIPFIDLRAHLFNNKDPAFNVGFGGRYLSKFVWGWNAYYDYRRTTGSVFQQAAIGFELLGKTWELKLNGYLPFGRKSGKYYQLRFDRFRGNHMILQRRRKFAMKSVNGEIGGHFLKQSKYKFYLGVGPYCLRGSRQTAWGGKGRLNVIMWDAIRLEVSGSYDKIFRGIVQGEAGLSLAFGPKRKSKKESGQRCDRSVLLRERAYQRIDRNEIIPLETVRKQSVAINPETGAPFVFWFVDNNSQSNGTYESPYHTLAAAQNSSAVHDILYILPGDGTNRGMNVGVTMKNNQKLLGASIPYTFTTTKGNVTIYPHAKTAPLITAAGIDPVITLADNNTVSGLRINQLISEYGIKGTNVLNGTVVNNVIQGVDASNDACIYFELASAAAHNSFYQISNNTLNCSNALTGITITGSTSATVNFMIENNSISSALISGITTRASSGFSLNGTIRNNTLTNCQRGVEVRMLSTGQNVTARLISNNISGQVDTGISPKAGVYFQVHAASSGTLRVDLQNNRASSLPAGFTGYIFENNRTASAFNVSFANSNQGSSSVTVNAVLPAPCH